MIETTTSVGFPAISAPPSGAAPAGPIQPVPSTAPGAQGDGESAPRRAPISLSVDRDATGVFVYTLTDSASGRILAVIPRSAVAPTSQQGVDIQA